MRHWLSLLTLILVGALLLSGCAGSAPETSEPESSVEQSADASVDISSEEPSVESEEPIVDPSTYNRLTGEYTLPAGTEHNRPVGIMINNIAKARPQYGLDKADWFFELETEGGITRIMAVFPNAESIPEQLGSVRSARTPFVLFSQSLDILYTHAGGSKAGLSTLNRIGIEHINALAYDGSTFWRDAALRAEKGAEYSMMTNGEKMADRIERNELRTTTDRALPFGFGENIAVGADATEVQVKFSGYQTISFTYNAEEGLYYKANGTLDDPTPHLCADGSQIAVSNVVVMYDGRYWENDETISFVMEEGEGVVITGGKAQKVTWTRTADSLTFTDADGKTVEVNPGKTYFCLLTKDNQDATVLK